MIFTFQVQVRSSDSKTEVGTEEGDTSLGTVQASDIDAKDPTPDLLVHYVIAGEIDKPEPEHVEEYYPDLKTSELRQDKLVLLQHNHTLRAGIKVVDRHCALIGEIKALPVKKAPFRLDAWTRLLAFRFSEAVAQALFYCAVHFFIQDKRNKVIVLSAVGPYWSWGLVRRDQVPAYDWITGDIMKTPENQKKAASLTGRLGWESNWKKNRIYTLGTPESDEELTKIRNKISSAFNSTPDETVHPTKYNFTIIEEEPLFRLPAGPL
ncbi:hypothetical protein BJ322DRAFT_1014759 [Thelephora terrestris]|uniref:Uncharacterized protein n=1 Tax=Thelephora terrestris TaxID=56493 RepID=A0A9P6L0Z0_9AGAM|nr:hypothetical protein BJ322DRAFT_1014759 [Thelephora terrestris]